MTVSEPDTVTLHMKSLGNFYIEQGICRTELAARLGISAEVLLAEEEAPVPSEAMQKAVTASFGIPTDYFTAEPKAPLCLKDGKPIYDLAQLKGYFFKTAFVWLLLTELIIAVPYFLTGIVGLLDTIIRVGQGANPTETFLHNETFLKAELIVSSFLMTGLPAFSGIFLAKHITKRTDLQGNLKKYQYLYWALPNILTMPLLTAVTSFLKTRTMPGPFILLPSIIEFLVTCGVFLLNVWLCAQLLDTAVTKDAAKQQRKLCLFGGWTAAAGVLSFGISCVFQVFFSETAAGTLFWAERISALVLTVAAAVCIGFVPKKSPKSETIIFKVLPLAAVLIQMPFTIIRAVLYAG